MLAVASPLLDRSALLLECSPGAIRVAHGRGLRRETAAAVEQFALVAAPRQRLELELTVDVEQVLAERAQ